MKQAKLMIANRKSAALIVVSVFAFASIASADVKVGGHLDVQGLWQKDGSNNGFHPREGSLKLMGETGKTSAMIDAPITVGYGKPGDTSLAFSGQVAQAWIANKYDMGMSWKLGQFDTLFGMEANDSVDYRYTAQGAVWSNFIPKTHLGITAGYQVSDVIGVQALVASKTNGWQIKSGDGVQFGAVATAKLGVDVKAGVLFADSTDNILVDLGAGTKVGDISVDAGVDLSLVDGADTGVGISVDGAMPVMGDQLTVGVRPEYLMNVGTGLAAMDSVVEVTVGPQYKMSENLKTKLDYTLTSSSPAAKGADSVTGHQVAAAVVYGF